jgi:integrase/recombinase XerD
MPVGGHVPGSLLELIGRWLADMRVRHYAPTSVIFYETVLGLFAAWLAERDVTQAAAVTRPMIEAYQRHLARQRGTTGRLLAVNTQYSRLKALMTLFRWAVRRQHLPANPAADIDLPRLPKPLPDTLSAVEVDTLLAQIDTASPAGLRDRAMLEVLWSTGLRRAELLALTLSDIDAERGLVRVVRGKGGKDRVVPIGQRALAWLERYLVAVRSACCREAGDLWLWVRPEDGAPVTVHALTGRVKGYLRAAGLARKGSCHLLRHAMASTLLENGCDVRLIQQILGHTKLDTTALYTHVSIRQLQVAHAAFHPAAGAADGEVAGGSAEAKPGQNPGEVTP